MTFNFESHLDFHINELVEAAEKNVPIVKKLYANPSEIPLEDLIVLRERLHEMEANITLLHKAREIDLKDAKKTKRSLNPFKK